MKIRNIVSALSAASALTSGANATVTAIATQAAFSASGTIAQNTNFDAYVSPTHPGSPYTIGDLTFDARRNLISVPGGKGAGPRPRPLFVDDLVDRVTIRTAGTYNLFAFNIGDSISEATNIDIGTNLGSYHFTPTIYFYGVISGALTPLTFQGFQASAGEYFTSIRYDSNASSGGVVGATDIQLGNTVAVPEPTAWALMIVGFGLVGVLQRRRANGYATA